MFILNQDSLREVELVGNPLAKEWLKTTHVLLENADGLNRDGMFGNAIVPSSAPSPSPGAMTNSSPDISPLPTHLPKICQAADGCFA